MPKIKKSISDYQECLTPEKFWSWVKKSSLDACWEWQGGKNTTGYGLYSMSSPSWLYERTGRQKTQLLAHRVAWYLTNGAIGDDQVNNHICHKCDNRLCCNPSHMFMGSMYDNVHDMVAKGRAAWQK